jgi:hypothetical protein
MRKFATKAQNTKRANGEKFIPLKIREDEDRENTNRKATAASNAITPPNSLGIDQKDSISK